MSNPELIDSSVVLASSIEVSGHVPERVIQSSYGIRPVKRRRISNERLVLRENANS